MPDHTPELTEEVVDEAISDATSRKILSACMGEPRAVKQISDAADVPLATTYRHVDDLEEAGLLIVERSAMTEDGSRYDLYRSRVQEILVRVSRQGTQITWEVEGSVEDRIARMWEQMRL